VALLTVLWVVATASIVTGGMLLQSRQAVGAAQNRVSMARAAWRVEGCTAEALARIDEILGERSRGDSSWDALDHRLAERELTTGCHMSLRPVGLAVDVNMADETQLRALFRAAGMRASQADSLADAILDWTDVDDTPRVYGVESDWYARQHRYMPRNGPLAARDELWRIRGADSSFGLDTLLTTEPGRILIGRAPLPVLASLPGVGDEAVTRIAAHRAGSPGVITWVQVSTETSSTARGALMLALLDLERRTTALPDAWILLLHAAEGQPKVSASIELRIVRWGERARVARRHRALHQAERGQRVHVVPLGESGAKSRTGPSGPPERCPARVSLVRTQPTMKLELQVQRAGRQS